MILICDDDATIRTSLTLVLKRAGYEVATTSAPQETIDFVRNNTPELILMDMNYSNSTTGEEGLELLAKVRVFLPDVPVILITAWGSINLAVQGIRAGAFDFITKPWNNLALLNNISTAIQISEKSNSAYLSEAKTECSYKSLSNNKIIGKSPLLQQVLNTVSRIAQTNAPVLITGESGTGKELIAEAIHENSTRGKNPFVKVNLGGISQSLFESEMFGHKKGAFTDAHHDRTGRFELADKGTILLDEIAEMPLELQVKLLRVLQENEFERVGSLKTTKFNARIICSTNRDIEELAEKGLFRQDLYYRINIIELYIPPLRERYDDILPLCKHFITNLNQDGNKKIIDIDARVLDLFRQYDWPGNVRELKHVIERAYVTCKEEILSLDYLDFFKDRIVRQKNKSDSAPPDATLREHRHQAEKQAIIQALKQAKGNKTKAAQLLQIDRSRLYYKLKKFNLDL